MSKPTLLSVCQELAAFDFSAELAKAGNKLSVAIKKQNAIRRRAHLAIQGVGCPVCGERDSDLATCAGCGATACQGCMAGHGCLVRTN